MPAKVLTLTARLTIIVALALLSRDAAAQEVYTVKAGDTLYHIATTHGLTVDRLKQLNGLTDNIIKVGQVLTLGDEENVAAPPDTAAPEAATPEEPAPQEPPAAVEPDEPAAAADPLASAETSEYVVQAGETLYSIANRLGTKAYILYTMNGGLRDPLAPGLKLQVPRRAQVHRVRSGDTLSKVARQYDVTVEELRRANALSSDVLEVGRSLTIPGTSAPPAGGGEMPRVYAAGEVVIFPSTYAGRSMANGEAYDPQSYVVSHRELPFDTILLVENPATGAVTFARVADRGPLDEDHLMDVSDAVARQLGLQPGRRIVKIRLVE